ncbi:MAG: hypothetical protein J6T67_10015 [Paludibacteraceae bacterium]|nr:hypothetical protein [Paludibacteraceae bacterium]
MNRLKKYIGILIGIVFSFVLLPSCNTNNESAHIEEERNSIAVFLYSRDSVPAHYVVQNTLDKGEYRYMTWYEMGLDGERKHTYKKPLCINKDTLFGFLKYHDDTIRKIMMVRDSLTHHFTPLVLDEKGDSIPYDSLEHYYEHHEALPGSDFVTKFRGKQVITLNGQSYEAYRFDKQDVGPIAFPLVEKIYFDSLFNILSLSFEWMDDESANIPYNGLIRYVMVDYDWLSASLIRLDSVPEVVKCVVDSLSMKKY